MPEGALPSEHLSIAALLYPELDQLDLAGPFEVLARLPKATIHVVWKRREAVRDMNGLSLVADMTMAESPDFDVLLVPGGHGQQALMEDIEVLSFLQRQASQAKYILSVCTGALLCGAAGILKGMRATTHWNSFELLKYFGAIPTDARVVIDGKIISTAGVTSGIDGALQLAALLRGDTMAQQIQLSIQYAPEPPFASGDPKTAPAEVKRVLEAQGAALAEARLAMAKRIARGLGVPDNR